MNPWFGPSIPHMVGAHIHLTTLKSENGAKTQGICATAGTMPAVLVRWLAISAGSPSLYVAIT